MFVCVMLLLAGCGRPLIVTTGFRRGEVFRIGSDGCRIGEVRVYLLDLQKENEALYGTAIWESGEADALQQTVKDQALARITRVKALIRIGVSRNVMLTMEEERLAEEAEHNYYAGLSDAEKKYIDLDEKNLQRMFREYALADKTWRSLGESAEQTFEDFYEKTPCDLNTRLWQKTALKKLEGDPAAPGFNASYQEIFRTGAGTESASEGGTGAAAEAGTEDAAEGETGAAAEAGTGNASETGN